MGFGFGPGQVFLLTLVVLLLFGNRIPQMMRSIGTGIGEFKKGLEGAEDRVKE